MKLFSLLFLALGSLAFAQYVPPGVPSENASGIELSFVYGANRSFFEKTVFEIDVAPAGAAAWKTLVFAPFGEIKVFLPPGDYFIRASTEGWLSSDYSVRSPSSAEILLWPAGKITGVVKKTDGTRAASALTKVSCGQAYGDSQFSADDFGEFEAAAAAGECTVSAKSGSEVGSAKVPVEQGKASLAEVVLSEKVSGAGGDWWLSSALALAAIAVIGLIAFIISRNKTRKEKPAVEKRVAKKSRAGKATRRSEAVPSGIERTPRMNDVTATLSEKEKEVVEFLLKHRGKAKQNKLRRELLIPKTSLARILSSLQNKNVIELESFMNTKKVSLTRWFLEK